MAEYIERRVAVNAIMEKLIVYDRELLDVESGVNIGIRKAASAVAELPAADVKPVVRGEWIVKQTAIGKDYTVCSVCNTDFKFKTDKGTLARLDMRGMSYCPNCGADLREVNNEN